MIGPLFIFSSNSFNNFIQLRNKPLFAAFGRGIFSSAGWESCQAIFQLQTHNTNNEEDRNKHNFFEIISNTSIRSMADESKSIRRKDVRKSARQNVDHRGHTELTSATKVDKSISSFKIQPTGLRLDGV